MGKEGRKILREMERGKELKQGAMGDFNLGS
jgi:hypothetical protein